MMSPISVKPVETSKNHLVESRTLRNKIAVCIPNHMASAKILLR